MIITGRMNNAIIFISNEYNFQGQQIIWYTKSIFSKLLCKDTFISEWNWEGGQIQVIVKFYDDQIIESDAKRFEEASLLFSYSFIVIGFDSEVRLNVCLCLESFDFTYTIKFG